MQLTIRCPSKQLVRPSNSCRYLHGQSGTTLDCVLCRAHATPLLLLQVYPSLNAIQKAAASPTSQPVECDSTRAKRQVLNEELKRLSGARDIIAGLSEVKQEDAESDRLNMQAPAIPVV